MGLCVVVRTALPPLVIVPFAAKFPLLSTVKMSVATLLLIAIALAVPMLVIVVGPVIATPVLSTTNPLFVKPRFTE